MAKQKYSIIEKLDAGGMAEVWKGKATSLRGFEKLVAIKRVLPALARNKKFIAMFLDEARLGLHLNHANVVQTFDIGVSENAYFIVMEWVDGSNLKTILEIARELGLSIPVEQAVFVAMEVCKGLSHAHNRRDAAGRPLNIVHRDISPPNVLLSREGEVKLVDFGLAKAASQISLTDPGIVKGKFSYLSPEATMGQPVDFRADLFAVGAMLWEILTGRRLFDGETDLKTVELIRATRVPSIRSFRPEAHPALDAILQKTLARDPRDRFQSAEALGCELARHLFENRLLVTSYDIASLVRQSLSTGQRRRPTTVISAARALDHTIQEEIEHFTSLEDLERMEFRAIGRAGESAPLGAEDPRGWAAELGVVDGDETIIDVSPGDLRRNGPARGFQRQVHIEPPLGTDDQDADGEELADDREFGDELLGEPSPAPAPAPPAPAPRPASRPAPAPTPEPPPSLTPTLIGVGLGVLGAILIGGAAWYLLFQ